MPLVTYNLNIPLATNNPSNDQPNMQTNTNAINTILAVDHYPFNDSRGGTHKQVSLTNESAPGIPAGSSGVLYSNLANGQSWPFWQNSLGTFQILGQDSILTTGYTTLPGGLIMEWGFGTLPGSSNPTGTITFPLQFPNACFNVQVSLNANSNTSQANTIFTIGTPTVTSFKWGFTGSTSYNFFYWTALGN